MECPQCHLAVSDAAVRCPACRADIPGAPPTLVHERGELEVLDDKWALVKKLGQGGMGTVYLAHDVELERPVAVKMMAMSLSDDAELVTRFEREARMMAKLEHPNVVPVYAVGRCDGAPYIVMKYLEGQSLQDYLRARGRLPLGEVLWITQQACDGLQFIHDRGVVHRDLKPANIFIGPNGHVTLLDLGVAHDTKNVMTRSGVIVGTPRYMAPEQVQGKRVDFHADLYALATVIFELLTGGPVFAHDSDYSIMRAQVDEPPPPPSSRADVPESLTPVLTRALAKEPAARYPNALALAEALAEALGPEVRPVRPKPVLPVGHDEPGATPLPAPRRATPRPAAKSATEAPSPATSGTERPLVAPTRSGPVELPEASPTRLDPEPEEAGLPSPPPTRQATPPPTTRDAPPAPPRRRRTMVTWVGASVTVLAAVLAAWRPWGSEPSEPPGAPPPASARATSTATPSAGPGAAARPAPADGPVAVDAPAAAAMPAAPTPATEPAPGAPAPPTAEPAPSPGPGTAGAPSRAAVSPAPPAPAAATAGTRDGELRLVVTSGGRLSWAYVDLDGLRQGTTPLTVRVGPGSHTLVFHREGFAPVRREVSLRPGETRKVAVELEAR